MNTTLRPRRPDEGENDAIVGAGRATEKTPALVATPDGVATAMRPLPGFAGATNVSWLEDTGVKDTDVPPSRTAETPVRLEPFTVTTVPGAPRYGRKLETTG